MKIIQTLDKDYSFLAERIDGDFPYEISQLPGLNYNNPWSINEFLSLIKKIAPDVESYDDIYLWLEEDWEPYDEQPTIKMMIGLKE